MMHSKPLDADGEINYPFDGATIKKCGSEETELKIKLVEEIWLRLVGD